MNIDGKAWRTIWLESDGCSVGVIDQTLLPHRFTTSTLRTCDDAAHAIRTMVVRGAPLIGVTGAYGLMLALQVDPSDAALQIAFDQLNGTRPTAVNLRWALERVRDLVVALPPEQRAEAAKAEAGRIADEDVAMCAAIGDHGLEIFQRLAAARPAERQGEPFNVLTHCNAGWLATVDWGTALAPIYKAHRAGLNIHVWVDETRPRNQGASLTAYELSQEGVPHTVVASDGMWQNEGLGWDDDPSKFAGHPRTSGSHSIVLRLGREHDVGHREALAGRRVDDGARHLGAAAEPGEHRERLLVSGAVLRACRAGTRVEG